jgi:hypothetical protein
MVPCATSGDKGQRAVLEVGFGLEELKEAAGADAGTGDEAPALRQLVDRDIELRQVRLKTISWPTERIPDSTERAPT